MLQNLRENSQGIIAKVIVGFIIITFALWGVDSLVGLATADRAPVSVNGVDISEQQIQQSMELQRRQLLAQMGENADPSLLDDKMLRNLAVQRLIEETLLIESANQQGRAVGNDYLDQIIVATREFQVDGEFNRDQFTAMLRNAGMTPMMYRDLLRRETLIGQEQAAIVTSAFVAPAELQQLRALDRQTRDLRYVTLSVAETRDAIQLSDEEIEAFYEQQKGRFLTEEQVVLDYLSLDMNTLAQQVEVSDAALQSAYEQLVSDFQGDEAREAAHILIAVGTDRDAAAAKARADEVRARLDGGEDFAALAREFSDDTGSAEEGGNLGMVERDVMVPEFEEALFALREGEVSQPVETDFGYHLIKLGAIERSTAPSFEEARSGLLDELRQREAESLFVAKVEELADVSFSAADLAEPAEVLGLEIQTAPAFGRDGDASLLGSRPRVVEAAFSDDVLKQGHNSAVIELSPQQAVVVRLNEYLPRRQLELAEVREQIVAELTQEKASAQVEEKAQALAQAVKAGESTDVDWIVREGVQRGDQTLPGAMIRELFRMPKPADAGEQVATIALEDGSAAVAVLTAVNEGESASLEDAEMAMLQGFLANRHGQYDYRGLVGRLKAEAEVDRL